MESIIYKKTGPFGRECRIWIGKVTIFKLDYWWGIERLAIYYIRKNNFLFWFLPDNKILTLEELEIVLISIE
jgi:hypothetical protein